MNVVTDGAGKLVESTTYQPFGRVHRREVAPGHSVTSPLRHSFTGQREETASGLLLFPARPYDPALGRFLQPDPFVQEPADPQALNRYSYVRNNPVNFVDPSGYKKKRHHFWQKVLAIVAAVVVSVITGNPELGLSLGVQLLAVGAAAAAGSAVGAQIDIAVARAGAASADPGGPGSPRGPPNLPSATSPPATYTDKPGGQVRLTAGPGSSPRKELPGSSTRKTTRDPLEDLKVKQEELDDELAQVEQGIGRIYGLKREVERQVSTIRAVDFLNKTFEAKGRSPEDVFTDAFSPGNAILREIERRQEETFYRTTDQKLSELERRRDFVMLPIFQAGTKRV